MKLRLSIACAAALLAVAGAAQAQFQKPDDAVKYRQGALFVMGQHFSRVGAMATGRAPFDAAVAQENMAVVMALAQLPWVGFTPDTQNVRSRAKPNVWTEKAKFDEAGQNTLRSLTALNNTVKAGDLDAIRRAFQETAASCKACHDNFRD
ncbi:c-type cytochrome [Tepidicella xavieri]|jgi:cytochrome c556|uniref:Cytochrome c556 n=1 Tax=Tepidicella xavieri TaxID=360241 RepID=A0A4V3D5A1_9BURK|nr:cytochrome c [Tepidicella xavieri]TDQ39297.1 cytochrome c556 [Tepidicella xavieri]